MNVIIKDTFVIFGVPHSLLKMDFVDTAVQYCITRLLLKEMRKQMKYEKYRRAARERYKNRQTSEMRQNEWKLTQRNSVGYLLYGRPNDIRIWPLKGKQSSHCVTESNLLVNSTPSPASMPFTQQLRGKYRFINPVNASYLSYFL